MLTITPTSQCIDLMQVSGVSEEYGAGIEGERGGRRMLYYTPSVGLGGEVGKWTVKWGWTRDRNGERMGGEMGG